MTNKEFWFTIFDKRHKKLDKAAEQHRVRVIKSKARLDAKVAKHLAWVTKVYGEKPVEENKND